MDGEPGSPEIGCWYARKDKGEMFQVVGRDESTRAIEIQTYDGDIDEIDGDLWRTLPLERTDPPEDGNAPMDLGEPEDLGYTATEMSVEDWDEALAGLREEAESWQDADDEEERDPLGEGMPVEPFSADEQVARVLV
jgi:hypothetical protein